jgi:hypothetical protein
MVNSDIVIYEGIEELGNWGIEGLKNKLKEIEFLQSLNF